MAGERLCNACGKENREQARFCGYCGKPFQSTSGEERLHVHQNLKATVLWLEKHTSCLRNRLKFPPQKAFKHYLVNGGIIAAFLSILATVLLYVRSETISSKKEFAKATSIITEEVKNAQTKLQAKEIFASAGRITDQYFEHNLENVPTSPLATQIFLLKERDEKAAKTVESYFEEIRGIYTLDTALKLALASRNELERLQKLLNIPEVRQYFPEVKNFGWTSELLELELAGKRPLVEDRAISVLKEKLSSALKKGDSVLKLLIAESFKIK